MIDTVNFSRFLDSFSEQYKNNFSYEGKRSLFDYLENLEEETGEQIELDPIALCCEYSEFDNFKELQSEYSVESMEDLEGNTTVIPVEGTDRIIIADY